MTVFLAIETSQSNGTTRRLAMGIQLPLVSWLAVFARLF